MNKPTTTIKNALEKLCAYNDHTRGKVVGEMYLGSEIFVATLRPRPLVLRGEWETVNRTIDIFDLMEEFQNEQGA